MNRAFHSCRPCRALPSEGLAGSGLESKRYGGREHRRHIARSGTAWLESHLPPTFNPCRSRGFKRGARGIFDQRAAKGPKARAYCWE
eukprot:44627-Pyramimonas_sp.AAC.1